MKNIYFSNSLVRNSQNFVWKIFWQAIAKSLFVLRSTYTGNTPYKVLLHLNNSLTQWKRSIFEIP